jgi:hypothetical protein
MKKLILSIVLLLTTLVSNAQIGVITIKKNESAPLNMWYTIYEKGREDNLYITFDNEDLAIYTLGNLLGQFDMEIELPNDKDVDGDPYWTVEQENGYISDIYYIKEKKLPIIYNNNRLSLGWGIN